MHSRDIVKEATVADLRPFGGRLTPRSHRSYEQAVPKATLQIVIGGKKDILNSTVGPQSSIINQQILWVKSIYEGNRHALTERQKTQADP